MFEEFLYTLRRGGLKVSLTEWMALMEALEKGLHGSSFTGFYHLCRALLVKSEADFDRFDRCFLQYFKDVPFEQEVSQELLDWLDRPDVLRDYANWDEEQARLNELLSEEEIEQMLKERMEEQKEEHNGGKYWVGTHGMSTFGNSGLSPKGIRGGGVQGSAPPGPSGVAGEAPLPGFPGGQHPGHPAVPGGPQAACGSTPGWWTCLPPSLMWTTPSRTPLEHGGMLTVHYKKPRQNTVKVLLMMDSGGSMDYYAQLCSALFQAVSKVGHFKDLKVYYFHNCPYTRVYQEPTLDPGNSVPISWLLSNLSSEYKLILVGDAQMSPHEIFDPFPIHREK